MRSNGDKILHPMEKEREREQSKSLWLSDKLYIAINDSLHCQFIPLWISWCGHKSMWPVVLRPLWLFIYSSKERGVKMPAYMTAGVVATVACVHLCTTHLKLTLLTGLALNACQKLGFKTSCLSVKGHLSSGTGVYITLYSRCPACPFSSMSTHHKKLGCPS